jgi:hypothetical protein
MSLLDDQTLHRMAIGSTGTSPAPARPLPEIVHRARQLRRHRATAGGGLTVIAVVLVVWATTLVGHRSAADFRPAIGTQQARSAPTAASVPPPPGCAGSVHGSPPLRQFPELLLLPAPAVVPEPPVGPVTANENVPHCAGPGTAAVWYATDHGVVTARMQVFGPGVTNPYRSPGGTWGGQLRLARQGQRLIELYYQPGRALGPTARVKASAEVFWAEADGSTWNAYVEGLDQAQILAALADVETNADGLDPTGRPALLPEAADLGSEPARLLADTTVTVRYGAGGHFSGELTMAPAIAGWEAPLGGSAVQVGDSPGWGIQAPDGTFATLIWRRPNGVLVRLDSPDNRASVLRVARSLQSVRPDDPRLAG